MTISSTYGTSGPIRDTGMVRISPSRSFCRKRDPEWPNQIGERPSDHHREGLHHPHQDRGDEAAGERSEPAEYHHDKHDRPHRVRHARLGGEVVAGDHAGEPASSEPPANTMVKTRGTL